MGNRTPPLVRKMAVADLALAIELSLSEGWNQTSNDWARVLNYEPDGCFVAEIDGALAGTVTTTRYGDQLAWIGMMLVRPNFRRRGVGIALMERALGFLKDHSVKCVKLDATPLGEPLYARLGFQREWSFHRWERPSKDSPILSAPDIEFSLTEPIHQIDQVAFGVDRSDWLSLLASESSTSSEGDSFAMIRDGRRAVYLGPVVATSPASARRLIDTLTARCDGPVFWDVPGTNTAAIEIAKSLDFRPVRDLTRMWLGDELVSPEVGLQFALAGPAVG